MLRCIIKVDLILIPVNGCHFVSHFLNSRDIAYTLLID